MQYLDLHSGFHKVSLLNLSKALYSYCQWNSQNHVNLPLLSMRAIFFTNYSGDGTKINTDPPNTNTMSGENRRLV